MLLVLKPIDTISISFNASSSKHEPDTFSLTILVKNVNRIPTAESSIVAAIEEVSKNIKIIVSDEDGDTLNWIATTLPTNGQLDIKTGTSLDTISLNYTSKNLSSAFNDEFILKVTDGVDTITETVSIVVNADNDAPVITGQVTDPFVITEGVPFSLSIDSINVSDPDDNISDLTFTVLDGTGYSVSANTITVDEFTSASIGIIVSVKDDDNATIIDTLNASVIEVNDIPVINGNGTVQWYEDNALDLSTVYFNITDSDDNSHTVFAINGSNYTIDATGSIITPEEDFDDSIFVNVKASDGKDTSVTFIARLLITGINDTPVVNIGIPLEGPSVEFGGTCNIPISVDDPEGIKSLKIYRNNSDVIFTLNGNFTSDTIPWTNVYSDDIIGKNQISVVVIDSSDVWVSEKDTVSVLGTWISDSITVQTIIDSNNYKFNMAGLVPVSAVSTIENGRIVRLAFDTPSSTSSLTSINADLQNLTNLKVLYFWNHSFTSLPRGLNKLSKLDSLVMYNCTNFNNLPYKLNGLISLKSLIITNSKIESLPSDLRLLPLEFIDLKVNELSSLPFVPGDFPSLPVEIPTFVNNRLHPSDPPEDWALWLDEKFGSRDAWYDGGNTQKAP